MFAFSALIYIVALAIFTAAVNYEGGIAEPPFDGFVRHHKVIRLRCLIPQDW